MNIDTLTENASQSLFLIYVHALNPSLAGAASQSNTIGQVEGSPLRLVTDRNETVICSIFLEVVLIIILDRELLNFGLFWY